MILIIVIVLLIFLVAPVGYGRYYRTEPWGWGPSLGPFWFILIILLIIYFAGGFRHL